MKVLRLVAVLLGLSLMIGEAIRSWGQDRPMPAWLDDQLMGALLIASAWLLRKSTPARRALFTGAWGVGVGVGALYLSFFGKLLQPAGDYSTNIPGGMLTLLIGLAFATAIAGFAASLIIPFESAK